MIETIMVSSTTDPKQLAMSIAGHFPSAAKHSLVEVPMECIGAGAVNQAVKGLAIARGLVAPAGYNLVLVPAFFKTTDPVRKEVISGIRMHVMHLVKPS